MFLIHLKTFLRVFPTCRTTLKTLKTFFAKQDDIIRYIVKARVDNLIYVYRNSRQIPIPGLPGKSLRQATSNELFVELEDAVSLLALKGIHQTIKHLYPMLNDNNLSDELLQQDISVIQRKYGLR